MKSASTIFHRGMRDGEGFPPPGSRTSDKAGWPAHYPHRRSIRAASDQAILATSMSASISAVPTPRCWKSSCTHTPRSPTWWRRPLRCWISAEPTMRPSSTATIAVIPSGEVSIVLRHCSLLVKGSRRVPHRTFGSSVSAAICSQSPGSRARTVGGADAVWPQAREFWHNDTPLLRRTFGSGQIKNPVRRSAGADFRERYAYVSAQCPARAHRGGSC
jgi:hypothetical protein